MEIRCQAILRVYAMMLHKAALCQKVYQKYHSDRDKVFRDGLLLGTVIVYVQDPPIFHMLPHKIVGTTF